MNELINDIRRGKVSLAEQTCVDNLKELGITTGREEVPTHEINPTTGNNTLISCKKEGDSIELRKIPNFCPLCGEGL